MRGIGPGVWPIQVMGDGGSGDNAIDGFLIGNFAMASLVPSLLRSWGQRGCCLRCVTGNVGVGPRIMSNPNPAVRGIFVLRLVLSINRYPSTHC